MQDRCQTPPSSVAQWSSTFLYLLLAAAVGWATAVAAPSFIICRVHYWQPESIIHHVNRPALHRPQWQSWCCPACRSHRLRHPGHPFSRPALCGTSNIKNLPLDERLHDCCSSGRPLSTPLLFESKANQSLGSNIEPVHSYHHKYVLLHLVTHARD